MTCSDPEQFACVTTKGASEFQDVQNGNVAFSALDPTKITTCQPALKSQFLLRPTARLSDLRKAATEIVKIFLLLWGEC